MANRTVQPRPTVRRRVLHAATAEFSSAGFAAASLDPIAIEAGVDLSTIHHLVGGKDELYATVLLDALAEALALVGPAVAAAPSPEGRLRAAVAGIASVASDNPHFSPLLLREIASGGASLPSPVVAQMQLLFEILTRILSHGAAGGVFRRVDPFVTQMALAGSLLVVIAGAPIVSRLRGAGATAPVPAHLAESISDLLLDGVRPHDKKTRHPGAGRQR